MKTPEGINIPYTQEPIIFITDNCSNCKFHKIAFERRNIQYTTVNLSEPKNAQLLEQIKEIGFRSVPITYWQNKWYNGVNTDLAKQIESQLSTLSQEKQLSITINHALHDMQAPNSNSPEL